MAVVSRAPELLQQARVDRRGRCHQRAGFSLVDLLVALAVMLLLIGLMLPTLSGVRETTRKIVCMSNVRQKTLAMGMYADDFRSALPYSRSYGKSLNDPTFDPKYLMAARLAPPSGGFDGLGTLFHMGYGTVPGVYYCPSHTGTIRLDNYLAAWQRTANATILTNFQFRGGSSTGVTRLDALDARLALISDGLSTVKDFNHTTGGNVAWSDQSVVWYDDKGGNLIKTIPVDSTTPGAPTKVLNAWQLLDEGPKSASNTLILTP